MINKQHPETIDSLVERLEKKNKYDFIGKNISYTDANNNIIGEMDVCTIQKKGLLTYINYYEIKTGKTGNYQTARRQAKRFYNTHTLENGFIARFIYIPTRHRKLQYWHPKKIIPNYQTYADTLKDNHYLTEQDI